MYKTRILQVEADSMEVDFIMNAYVYAKCGGFLATENMDSFAIRIVMGLRYTSNEEKMPQGRVDLLKAKDKCLGL